MGMHQMSKDPKQARIPEGTTVVILKIDIVLQEYQMFETQLIVQAQVNLLHTSVDIHGFLYGISKSPGQGSL